jgi:type II secretory pathway pseudopilin PulG
MSRIGRSAFSLFELLVILALLGLLLALLLPAVAKVRAAASRTRSANNMKQIAISVHNYHDTHNSLPPGNDDLNFSAAARLLPYLEQANVFQMLDFKKPIDDKANQAPAKLTIAVFLSPNDPVQNAADEWGPTNYLFSAGSKYSLQNNNGVLYQDSKIKLTQITDGTSNTILSGETLRGDGGKKAVDVQRQHVLLKKDALGELNENSGVKEFAEDKNIAGNRCSAWIDGRFLQGTFTGTRVLNDKKPDVSCEGFGGISGLRTLGPVTNVGLCDGSVRAMAGNLTLSVWNAMTSRDGGEVVQLP